MRIALVCIAKNEDLYVQEWVNYHLKLGFGQIFIYQNDWRCRVDFDTEKVRLLKIDGFQQQNSAYNHFINQNYWNYDWAAFLDVDEFLVLNKHKNIEDFLNDYNQYNCIGINWAIFGNNDQESTNGEFSVIKRFTKRKKDPYLAIKTLMKLSIVRDKIPVFSNPHYADIGWYTTDGEFNNGPSSKTPTLEAAQVNHYFCKTRQEFLLKCKRGRAASKNLLTMDDFDVFNFNEVEDFNAYNYFYKS